MNHLSKKTTPLFFREEIRHDCYNEVRQHWLGLLKNSKEHPLTFSHYILYAILRGKDWRKTFTPVSNEVKIANGARADWSLTEAQYRLNSRLDVFNDFAPLIDPKVCSTLVRALLQGRRAWAYNPEPLEEPIRANISIWRTTAPGGGVDINYEI